MCGIVGITDHRDAPALAYLALFAQQHRGQESAGIAVAVDGQLLVHRGMGLVEEVFSPGVLEQMKGRAAIGHVRYSTAGGSRIENAQPLLMRGPLGPLALGHNGNITNAPALRRGLEEQGAIFHTSTDSEVIIHLIARHGGSLADALPAALARLEGAFSLVFLAPDRTGNRIIAVRDPWGFRPLVMGKLHGGVVFASETCALDILNARFVRELEPGEMVVAKGTEVQSFRPFPQSRTLASCVFEHVYLARPDSRVFGANVHRARRSMGRELARQMKGVAADLVVPVPDSGVPAALGFAEESRIPFEMGFIRNHYVGRTFIQPLQKQREASVRMKLHPVREVLEGKRIVLVDDSMVRGTTSRKIVRMLRKARVKEIHMAISSPPIIGPCFYGIDTPAEENLIAAKMSRPDIVRYLHVDSLHFLELERLLAAVGPGHATMPGQRAWCTACFTREYATEVPLVRIGGAARAASM